MARRHAGSGWRGLAGGLSSADGPDAPQRPYLLRHDFLRCILSRKGVLLCTEWLLFSWSPCSASARVILLRRLRTGRSTLLQLRHAAVHTSACAISTHILPHTTKTARLSISASSTTPTR